MGQSIHHRHDASADTPGELQSDNPAKPPAYMNPVDLDFKAANWLVIAISLAIGLGFIAVMPARSRRTRRSDAEELGILFCLMTVASPLARQYYFMWLFFPVTVLMHRQPSTPCQCAQGNVGRARDRRLSALACRSRFFRMICKRSETTSRQPPRWPGAGVAHPAPAPG